jgi:hypothetical protein
MQAKWMQRNNSDDLICEISACAKVAGFLPSAKMQLRYTAPLSKKAKKSSAGRT